MLYYRFRSSSELAIKELMYDEMYFSSTKECNDPFDGKTFLAFGNDEESWRRLLEFAWRQYNHPNKSTWKDQLAEYLCSIAPLTFDSALVLDYRQALSSLQPPADPLSALMLGQAVRSTLTIYKPKDTYFVSLSRECTDILMWSHYATMHKGHCLIFKAIDGQLHQCRTHKRSVIRRTTQAGIASSMNQTIPDSFSFQDVSYGSESMPGDAFSYFPEHVYGRTLDEQERIDLANEYNRQYLIKHECWSYENESRLILSPPHAWLFGEPIELTQHERLFHYQPSQLVGIILGARMESQQKMRVREIIQDRIDRIARDARDYNAVFDFVLFQAKLSDHQREVIVDAEEIFTLTGIRNRTDNDFDRLLNSWKEGWAMVLEGTRGYRRQFE